MTPDELHELERRLDNLLRGDRSDLDAYLTEVSVRVQVDRTKAQLHCYALRPDPSGLPRTNDLARAVALRVVDYAIPRSEIARAQEYDRLHNTTLKVSELKLKAKELFVRVKKTGEAGELLLYMLIQSYLRLPQIFCKMPHKTDPNMHVHGIDGIHAGIDSHTGQLALYWGESKLYQSVSQGVRECLDGLKPFVCGPGGSGGQQQRELELLRDFVDLNDPDLKAALLQYLDPDHPNFSQLNYRGIGLIGFDHSAYPTAPNSKAFQQVIDELRAEVVDWQAQLGADIKARTPLEHIDLNVFLLPFPSVQAFRDAFLAEFGRG